MLAGKQPANAVDLSPLFEAGLDGPALGAMAGAATQWRQEREADGDVVARWALRAKDEASSISKVADPREIATERGGMLAFNAMVAEGDFAGALAFSDQLAERLPEFGSSPMTMEKRIVCMNKSKPPLTDRAIEEARRLVEAAPQSGEAYGALGKALLTKSKEVAAAGDESGARAALMRSKDAYISGFEASGEFYPGINAAYRMVDLGEVEQARALARWVCLSAEACADNHDFWSTASAMEASVLAGDEAGLHGSLARLSAHKGEPGWMAQATLQSLAALDPQTFPLAAKAAAVIESSFEGVEPEPAPHPLLAKTFSYRGMGGDFAGGASVEGNMRFGGQLAAHSVTRWDRKVFRELLATPLDEFLPEAAARQASALVGAPALSGAVDPYAMSQALDVVARALFDTSGQSTRADILGDPGAHGEGLERLDSVEHMVFDEAVSGINKAFMGSRARGADSRTSVAMSLAVGLGDCRHHAQTKQLMFDLWQERRLAELAGEGSRMALGGDGAGSEALATRYQELAGVRMRTADVEVWSAVAGERPYQVDREPDGRRLAGLAERKVEEHTMNVLVVTDPSMAVVSARMADAFYHVEYDFASAPIPVAPPVFQAWAPSIELAGPEGPVAAPVRLAPAAYAGKRAAQSSDETGAGGLFMGADAGSFDVLRALAARKALGNRLCVAGLARAVPELLGSPAAPTLSGLSAGAPPSASGAALAEVPALSVALGSKLRKMRERGESEQPAAPRAKLGA